MLCLQMLKWLTHPHTHLHTDIPLQSCRDEAESEVSTGFLQQQQIDPLNGKQMSQLMDA